MEKPITLNSCNAIDLPSMLARQQSFFPCRIIPSTSSPRGGRIFSCFSSQAPAASVDSLKAVKGISNGQLSLANQLRHGGLTEDGLAYKEKFIVGCCQVGSSNTATIQAIANMLQESAYNHTERVGLLTSGHFISPIMRKLHLTWVTSRMHFEVDKYPICGDVVEIETWGQIQGHIGARRDWIIKDSATAAVIGRATSKWVMMNEDTRRFQKVSDEVKEEYFIHYPRTPRYVFPEKDNSSLKKIPRLEDPAQYSKLGLAPRRSDLDMNQHVNSITYIGWVTESIPREISETHQLQKITLDYKLECHLDDKVDSFASLETDSADIHGGNVSAVRRTREKDCFQFVHCLRLADSGVEITRSRTEWRRQLTN